MNVVFISNGAIVPMLVTGFLISFVWAGNVKKVSLGSRGDKLVYATGATVGTGVGYFISKFLIL